MKITIDWLKDHIITNKIWTSMIKAYIDYEYRNFKKKK